MIEATRSDKRTLPLFNTQIGRRVFYVFMWLTLCIAALGLLDRWSSPNLWPWGTVVFCAILVFGIIALVIMFNWYWWHR